MEPHGRHSVLARPRIPVLQVEDLVPPTSEADATAVRLSATSLSTLSQSPRRSSPPQARSRSPAYTTRLRKPAPVEIHARKDSGQFNASLLGSAPASLQDLKYDGGEVPSLRPLSTGRVSRPGTPDRFSRPTTPTAGPTGGDDKLKKKHGWFGRGKKDKDDEAGPLAWIVEHPNRAAYDVDALLTANPVRDLWDEDGDCLVYLFPRTAGRGPSFKVDARIFAASPVLYRLAFSSSSSSADRYYHLYLPIKLQSDGLLTSTSRSSLDLKAGAHSQTGLEDLQTLVDIRNFFAYLSGQALVATETKSSLFRIFMSIAGILKTYEFSNQDGSTYGEVATTSFDAYVHELKLADVRHSREKTIEGIVLGERMKSVLLYHEAFTHGVGRHEELIALKSPIFPLISNITQNRMIRAAMDLDKRTASVERILNDFDFPSLFTGIMNSKQSEERREGVRFDRWKETFLATRKTFMSIYSHRYGNWPPKARSKKNDLETNGLNRVVLLDLYQDMSSMYDLLVDRTSLTTRTVDGINLHNGVREESIIRALRMVLSEYDRSSPPVKPPVPFDLPKMPTLRSTRPDFDPRKDTKAVGKKLKDDEIAAVLRESYNPDVTSTPFINALREAERRGAHGCNVNELVDLRIGQWIFMYVVLQALPMLVCDAPDITHTRGVEYFLCVAPRSGVPWVNANTSGGSGETRARRTWASGSEATNAALLPSDVLDSSIEGTYKRSHCWTAAEAWTKASPILHSALQEQTAMRSSRVSSQGNGMMRPPPTGDVSLYGHGVSRVGTPTSIGSRHTSLGVGLEGLSPPVSVSADGRSASPGPNGRPLSVHLVNASKTFDAILADVGEEKKSKKK